MIKPLRSIGIKALLAAALLLCSPPANAGWEDLLRGAQDVLSGGGKGGLSQARIVQGLKEALHIGTQKAVDKVSVPGGYLDNPDIKIPLPDTLQKVEGGLRAIGYGSQVDSFEESMNRAAERAAPAARDLFVDAVKGMTFDDAQRILKGRDNEATLYFKDKTWDRLLNAFKPLVHTAMGETGVTRRYQELEAQAVRLPLVDRLGLDLDQYVSERALDGLFLMLEREEQKIRTDPSARVTEILKEVFGSRQ
ncbi:MAG: DUF4197 domain-containing protein [Desulfobacteraceae bacterium]